MSAAASKSSSCTSPGERMNEPGIGPRLGSGRMSRVDLWVNPVLARELTSRMRGPGAMIVLTIYLGLLGLAVGLAYSAALHNATNYGDAGVPVTQWAEFGQGVFEWTLLAILLLVLFLVPGFTAGSIAGERERLTLMPVQVTLLRPMSIVLGKIGASVVFTLLLVLTSLPLLTVTYLIGGVTLLDIMKGLGMVMFTALGVAAVALACSALMKRATTATLMSYGAVLVLTVGTLLATVFVAYITRPLPPDFDEEPHWIVEFILAANPVAALADAAGDVQGDAFRFWDSGNGPLTEIKESLAELRPTEPIRTEQRPVALVEKRHDDLDAVMWEQDDLRVPMRSGLPFWAWSVLLISTVAALSLTVACRQLRTPADRER